MNRHFFFIIVTFLGFYGSCYAVTDSTDFSSFRLSSQKIIRVLHADSLLHNRPYFVGVLGKMSAIVYNEKEESRVICFDRETNRLEKHVFPKSSFQRLFSPFPFRNVRREDANDYYVASYYAYYNKEGNCEIEFDRYTLLEITGKSGARYERPYNKETDLLDSLLLAFGERCVVEQYLLRNENNDEFIISTPRLYGHLKIGLWGRGNYYYSVIEDVNSGFVDTLIWNRYRKKARNRILVKIQKDTLFLPTGRWFYHAGDSFILQTKNNDGCSEKWNHKNNSILFWGNRILVQEE